MKPMTVKELIAELEKCDPEMVDNQDIIDEMCELGDRLPATEVTMVMNPEVYVRFCLFDVPDNERDDFKKRAENTLKELGQPPLVQVNLQDGTIAAMSD